MYVFHVVSSKLIGKAAHLISERPDIESWAELKSVLTQHFGDPRSEECIAIQLETLKINSNESYLDFCNRIQQVKSTLFAKVNQITDDHIRRSKITIYDNMALNVFLYNLPEDLIRIVRLKGTNTLEDALSIVLEEVNFKFQYESRNRMLRPLVHKQSPQPSAINSNPYIEKFGLKPFLTTSPQQNQGFRFGIPNQIRPHVQHQPNFGNQNFKFGIPTSNQIRPQFGQPNNQPKFIIPQVPQGYRPSFGQGQQPFRPPVNPPNQFKFGIPPTHQNNQKFNTDVTMRTALPTRNQAHHNELQVYSPCQTDDYSYYNQGADDTYYYETYEGQEIPIEVSNDETDQNFHQIASDTDPPN